MLRSGRSASLSAFWRRCAAAWCEDGCGPNDMPLFVVALLLRVGSAELARDRRRAAMLLVALCCLLFPWGCVATTGSCAATQSLDSPVVHDVRQCQFTDTTDGVCCHANTTGLSSSFLTSCRAQQDYLDCSNACDPGASTWSLQHQSADLGSGDLGRYLGSPRAGIRMCREMCLSYWHECFSNFASSEAGDDVAYCDGVAAPEGDTDCLQMPEAHCPNQCQGFGWCDMSKDLAAPNERPAGCECHSGYLGYDCSFKVVVAEWPFDIEVPGVELTGDVVGYCSILNSTCICTPLWFGHRCQARTSYGLTYTHINPFTLATLVPQPSHLPTSHTTRLVAHGPPPVSPRDRSR